MAYDMKDSGEREEFEGGAVRDRREGKGRYDLLSPFGLRRCAIVAEKGAAKYGDRNWEQGMPITRMLDSAIRHLYQALAREDDEDHLAHAMWNCMAAIHMEELRPPLDNRPYYSMGMSEVKERLERMFDPEEQTQEEFDAQTARERDALSEAALAQRSAEYDAALEFDEEEERNADSAEHKIPKAKLDDYRAVKERLDEAVAAHREEQYKDQD